MKARHLILLIFATAAYFTVSVMASPTWAGL
jgi:hypothetical protein